MFCNIILRIIINKTILPCLPPKQPPPWLFMQWISGASRPLQISGLVQDRLTEATGWLWCHLSTSLPFPAKILTLGRGQKSFLMCLTCWERAAQLWSVCSMLAALPECESKHGGQILPDFCGIWSRSTRNATVFSTSLALLKTRHTEI